MHSELEKYIILMDVVVTPKITVKSYSCDTITLQLNNPNKINWNNQTQAWEAASENGQIFRWYVGNNSKTFFLKYTFVDASKSLRSCTDGIWSTLTNKIVMSCGTSFKEMQVKSFSCDTITLQLSGIGPVNLIRQ